MKKLLGMTSLLALAFTAPVALPAVAHAQGASDHVDLCKVYVELDFYDSVGECVQGNEVSPVRACQFLKDEKLYPFDFDDESVENQGDCVRWFRHHR